MSPPTDSTITQEPRRLTDREIDALDAIFQQFPSIQAVYLFGSYAQGRPRVDSDIDLAIVPRRDVEPPDKLDMLTELARAGFDNVDLVILDIYNLATADLVLTYEAVRLNCLVYQTEDFERGAVYSKVVRHYLDFKPYLDVQRAAYKRRILHGQG
jgi:predicted nucleotidyltransferase